MISFLSVSAAHRAGLRSIPRKHGSILLCTRLGCRDYSSVLSQQRMDGTAARAGRIHDQLLLRTDPLEQARQFRCRNIRTRQIDLILRAIETSMPQKHDDKRIVRLSLVWPCSQTLPGCFPPGVGPERGFYLRVRCRPQRRVELFGPRAEPLIVIRLTTQTRNNNAMRRGAGRKAHQQSGMAILIQFPISGVAAIPKSGEATRQ